MIPIQQLRYVRLGTRDVRAAADFAQRVLGLQLIDEVDGALYLRSDSRDHTLVFHAGDPADQAVGVEVWRQDGFESAVEALRSAGIAISLAAAEACAVRKVKAMASFEDPAGNVFEIVLRPMNSGWRFHPTRDSGVTGLAGVALRSPDVAACERMWTTQFNARVSDWVGDAAYLRFDDAHHRLAYHPSRGKGVLAVEYNVESVDLLMQASYFLQASQIRIVHGPGRRPTSGQLFLTFAGPDDMLFSFVAEGDRIADEARHRPRQFARTASSLCAWGSRSEIPEFSS